MSRVLNSKIPILPALLEPKVVDPRPQLEQRRHKAVFDRGLPKLQAGEKVRMRRNHVWMPAIVVREEGHPRSYIVKQSVTKYRRNKPTRSTGRERSEGRRGRRGREGGAGGEGGRRGWEVREGGDGREGGEGGRGEGAWPLPPSSPHCLLSCVHIKEFIRLNFGPV